MYLQFFISHLLKILCDKDSTKTTKKNGITKCNAVFFIKQNNFFRQIACRQAYLFLWFLPKIRIVVCNCSHVFHIGTCVTNWQQ